MADLHARQPLQEALAAWRLAILGAAGVAGLLGLALLGFARLGPALIGAATLAALAALLIVVGREGSAPLTVPPTVPSPEREPPFGVMLEHIADPILLIAGASREDLSDRRFVFANAAAREVLRLQRQEGPLTTAMRAPEVLAAVEDALFGGDSAHAVYRPPGAQERFWRVSVSPLANVGSSPAGGALALLSLRDETEIRRSERMRADFLANASHELRTPLASLAGFIETLRGHARDDEPAREKFLAIMQIQADRMRSLINDLMSLSRIELSEHIAPSGHVDVALAVVDVLDALGPLAAEHCVLFQHDLPPTGVAVATGDRDQILQVILNLTENAIKYTPSGKTVAVEVLVGLEVIAATAAISSATAHLSLLTPDHAARQRYIALRVRDFGAGIARNHLPRLTERFYRVEGQKGRERPGTGLGLAIVKHIVNRHRGGLTVESAEGVGSIFTAYFPMAQDAKPKPSAS